MTFIIKRNTTNNQYVAGYDIIFGTPFMSNYPHHFDKKSDAQEIAKALNTFALLEDDAYRFEVFEITTKKVTGTVLAEGGATSAYNKRIGSNTTHEVEIDIEE